VTPRTGSHAVARQTFFEIMASFPSGVVVVTTLGAEGSPRGLTTTAVASVSADPPTVLVCVDQSSRTLAGLRARRRFVINFMAEGRSHLCLLFASKEDDKFASVDWVGTKTGLPLLHRDALAWAECSILHDVEIGDHALLVARVDDGGVQPELEPPLMYYRRSWGVWTPAHDPGEPQPEPVAPSIEVGARDLRWQGAEI
jgi:flavin reductase (DIM6/NTAB) family NADH-FMN oxidoreductase RutF